MTATGEVFFWNHFVLSHVPEVGMRMCRYGFGSGHRGVASPDYDITFDPEACQKAAITIMGFAQLSKGPIQMSVRLVSVQIFVTVWHTIALRQLWHLKAGLHRFYTVPRVASL